MILTVALWLLVTLAHVALTARAIHRAWPVAAASLDERLFATVLAVVGSLSIVLHVTAMTVGIGLASGTVALAAWHAVTARLVRRRSFPAIEAALSGRAAFTLVERLAATVFVAILLTWIGLAAASGDVLGPDAAHYHVPYAVNFATGVSPFSLPATPHLYPMAASVISAWFIVPTGDPLLVDLAMALPFGLLVVSINLLFRCATGRSGLAWASWVGLALFATPMFRTLSQGAADLWFTAAFMALIAVIVRAWSVGRWRALDLLLAGIAAGLLLGSKTTGAAATVLIVGTAVIMSGARRLAGTPRVQWPSRTPWLLAGATLACLASGAIWLVRNWVQFGSPLAPAGLAIAGYPIFPGETFQQTTYLSVLGEMQTNAFHLLPRVQFFVDQWFGGWYLPALGPIVILVADLVLSVRRRATVTGWWTRVALLAMTLVAGGILVWLLIGAPWTALERSRGLTLRYVLPVAVLLPLLAFIGCFPFSLDWPERVRARALVATALIAGVGWLWWEALGRPDPSEPSALAPGITLTWFVMASVLTTMLGTRAGRWLAMACLAVIAVAWWAPQIARADARVRSAALSRVEAEQTASAAGVFPADSWRQPYLALYAAERAEGTACARRRFFALTRFDEPLALQPPAFGSQVFYAGRDIEAARAAGPIGTCDYIITTPALQLTDKGQALAAALAGGTALHAVATTSDLVMLAAR